MNETDKKNTNHNPHANHRQRMRAKALKNVEMLEDHELLEIFLYGTIPYKDTNPIAHELLDRFSGLRGVMEASVESLELLPNMTHNAALSLKVMQELHLRANKQEAIVIKNSADFIHYVKGYCQKLTMEEFLILGVDPAGNVTYKEWLRGERASVDIDVKSITRKILNSNTSNVLLCHNHPTGRAFPSDDDKNATRAIRIALETFKIGLLDHLIVAANGEIFSMAYDRIVEQGSYDPHDADSDFEYDDED